MKLYLTRHGEAVAAEIHPDRPLSQSGQKQVAWMGAQLIARGVVVENMYHSGILRARQTAELLARKVHASHISPLSDLRPEDDIELIETAIVGWTQSVMLVGHLPYMSYLLAALTRNPVSVMFNPATVACLAPAGRGWVVEWILHPADRL